jgi:hypothetical protein
MFCSLEFQCALPFLPKTSSSLTVSFLALLAFPCGMDSSLTLASVQNAGIPLAGVIICTVEEKPAATVDLDRGAADFKQKLNEKILKKFCAGEPININKKYRLFA